MVKIVDEGHDECSKFINKVNDWWTNIDMFCRIMQGKTFASVQHLE